MSDDEREKSKKTFLSATECTYFVASQATGGSGLDGLQTVCHRAIYYTNSYNAIDRWQSEDRTHRMGMGDKPADYTDLVCRGSTDAKMRANLRAKKSLSDLALGDIMEMINGSD
jgi:SNF2 family DNA or RNA helicase